MSPNIFASNYCRKKYDFTSKNDTFRSSSATDGFPQSEDFCSDPQGTGAGLGTGPEGTGLGTGTDPDGSATNGFPQSADFSAIGAENPRRLF